MMRIFTRMIAFLVLVMSAYLLLREAGARNWLDTGLPPFAQALIGAAIVAGLVAAIFAQLAMLRLYEARRTLAEALRTDRQAQRASAAPSKTETAPSAATRPGKADTLAEQDGTEDQPDDDGASVVVQRKRRAPRQQVDDALHFQPYLKADSQMVDGYLVWLKVLDLNTGRSSHVLDAPITNRFEKAIFELRCVERALGQGKRIMAAGGQPDVRFHVPISTALLSSAEMVSSLRDLCRAHPGLRRALVLQVHGSAISQDAQCSKALYALYDDDFEMALDLTSGPADDADLDLVPVFSAIVMSAQQVQAANDLDLVTTDDDALGPRAARMAAQDRERARIWRKAMACGLPVLAHGVVCEAEMIELVSADIAHVAGPFFAPAKPIRAELLEPARLEKVRLSKTSRAPKQPASRAIDGMESAVR